MARRKYLSGRQLAVLDDLFGSDVDMSQVLRKHGIRAATFNRWRNEQLFAAAYRERLSNCRFGSELFMVRCVPLAATKLVELMDSENQEVARKACLNIMELTQEESQEKSEEKRVEDKEAAGLSEQEARVLLGSLAEVRGREKRG